MLILTSQADKEADLLADFLSFKNNEGNKQLMSILGESVPSHRGI